MAILTKTTDKSASCALIGYYNRLSATTTPDAQVMLSPDTYSRYLPTSAPTTVKFQLDQTQAIDFIGLAAHNAGTHDSGTQITFAYAATVGGALNTLEVKPFTDNRAYMLTFTEVTAAEIAITFDTTTTGLELGVIYAGKALQMEQPIYGGLTPPELASKTEYQSKLSDTGQFLGRDITIKGEETQLQWQNLTPEFINGDFSDFIERAKRLPFFIKWRPDFYPDNASYCHTTNDIRPQNMGGGHRRMSVGVSVRGFDE
jgi:hypothetical protein